MIPYPGRRSTCSHICLATDISYRLETETHQCQHQFQLLILRIWAHLVQVKSGLVIVDFC